MTLQPGKVVLSNPLTCTNTAKGDNKLYSDAKGVVPSLDLRFAEGKTLNDYMTGQQLITFSRSSIGTYVDENGIIQTAIADQPRFDHDPTTGESLGLLVEEARTNYISNSTSITFPAIAAAGTGSAPIVTTQTEIGPDGVSASITRCQFDRGAGNTANDLSLAGWNPTPGGNNANYSQSIWLKSNDANNYVIIMYDGAGTKGNEFTITPEWQRFTLDASTSYKNSNDTANTSPNLLVGLRNNPGNVQYFAGDINSQTADILVWGPQIENGTFVTSYIPTTGTALTRSADVASITGSNFSSWYNQTEGTIYTQIIPNGISANDYAYCFTDGTFKQLIDSRLDTTDVFHIVNVGLQVGIDFAAYTTGQSTKSAGAYALNNVAYASNGSIRGVDTSALMPTVDRLNLMDDRNGGDTGNGTISRFTYFPDRLEDSVLQAITQ